MTPTLDTFTVGAYWGSCAESLPQIVQKTTQTLKGLREIDSRWFKWFRSGINKETDLQQRVFLDEENIRKLCLTNVKRGESSKTGTTKSGYIFNVSTGPREGLSSGISFLVGSGLSIATLRNSCVVHLPTEGAERDRLLRPETTKSMLRLLVKIWRPEYALLTSRYLRSSFDLRNQVGWTTYRRELHPVPNLNDEIGYEKDEQGHWFTVKKMGQFSGAVTRTLSLLQRQANPMPVEYI